MKKSRVISIALICGLTVAAAQEPFHNRNSPEDRFARERALFEFEMQPARQVKVEQAARREAQSRERQFVEKLNNFVEAWRRFSVSYNERGAFDLKAAKALSKMFHELESSGVWPRSNRK